MPLYIYRAGGRRFAVLVNNFGSVNIDTRLVGGMKGETISLAGQVVGSRVNVTLGAPGGMDEAELQSAFDRCRTELSVEQTVAAQQTWMRGVSA